MNHISIATIVILVVITIVLFFTIAYTITSRRLIEKQNRDIVKIQIAILEKEKFIDNEKPKTGGKNPETTVMTITYNSEDMDNKSDKYQDLSDTKVNSVLRNLNLNRINKQCNNIKRRIVEGDFSSSSEHTVDNSSVDDFMSEKIESCGNMSNLKDMLDNLKTDIESENWISESD